MQIEPITDWHIWTSAHVSRLPLGLILDPKKRQTRSQLKDISESAYVYRMVELFFAVQEKQVTERLTAKEKKAVDEFVSSFKALPWKPLPSHPHISELVGADLEVLVPKAKKSDNLLWLRTGRGIYPFLYRLTHGWQLFEPSRSKQKPTTTST